MTADTSGPAEPRMFSPDEADVPHWPDDHRPGASDRKLELRNVGLFGGTFDPIHHGHLAAAWNVRQLLGLDEVWLVVANDPWQKSGGRDITPAAVRLRWVSAAVDGFDGLEASAVEIEAGGASYTYDTVQQLRADYPNIAWSVIIGADNVADLDTWHRADELRHEIEVVAVSRPGTPHAVAPDGWTVREIEVPPVDMSGTQLRRLAAEGRLLHFLIPAPVADDIAASGIYQLGGAAAPGGDGS